MSRRAGQAPLRPYRVPRPSACDLEHAYYYGDDAADLDEFEVASELAAIVQTLALLPVGARPLARAWLLRRRQRLPEAPPASPIIGEADSRFYQPFPR